jgi:hypothetical protein
MEGKIAVPAVPWPFLYHVLDVWKLFKKLLEVGTLITSTRYILAYRVGKISPLPFPLYLVLFEPDLDAISKTSSCVVVDSSMIKNELFSGSTNAVVLSPSSTTAERVSIQTRLRYNALHLNSHHAMINAIQTARLIGKTLGTRGCAKLIYKCIVDLQHDLIDANWAKYGKGQVNWLQQSLGLLFFANEVSFFVLSTNLRMKLCDRFPYDLFACLS